MTPSKPRKQYTPEFKAQAIELLALRGLRRENALLRQENDILKKAAVILGTKTHPNYAR